MHICTLQYIIVTEGSRWDRFALIHSSGFVRSKSKIKYMKLYIFFVALSLNVSYITAHSNHHHSGRHIWKKKEKSTKQYTELYATSSMHIPYMRIYTLNIQNKIEKWIQYSILCKIYIWRHSLIAELQHTFSYFPNDQ